MTPFELFKQDVEEVIMLINYFIEKGETTPSQNSQNSSKKEERIKVNDKTATGGWYSQGGDHLWQKKD